MLQHLSQWGSYLCRWVCVWGGELIWSSVYFHVCPRFAFSLHRALSNILGTCTQFHGQSKLCECFGPSQVFPIFMCSLIQECLSPRVLQIQAIWAEPLALTCPSENSYPQTMSLAITQHPTSWDPFKLRSLWPASCWQNLHANKMGQWGEMWVALSSNTTDSTFLSSTSWHLSKFYTISLWSISRVLKRLL